MDHHSLLSPPFNALPPHLIPLQTHDAHRFGSTTAATTTWYKKLSLPHTLRRLAPVTLALPSRMAFVPPHPTLLKGTWAGTAINETSSNSFALQSFRRKLTIRRCRPPLTQVSMDAQKKEEKEFQDAEEKRLQNDKKYVFREFGKICGAAVCIGLILLFYDILISLVALGVGSIYAIAVLLEVRGADTLLSRMVQGVTSTFTAIAGIVQEGYRAIRREVRKGLED